MLGTTVALASWRPLSNRGIDSACAERHRARHALQFSARSLLSALSAFCLEHCYCGELDTGVDDVRVWMSCTCGAGISRALEPIPH